MEYCLRSSAHTTAMCCRIWEPAPCDPFGTTFRLTAGWRLAGWHTTLIAILPWQHTPTSGDSQWGPGDMQQASHSCSCQPRYSLSSLFRGTRRLSYVWTHAISLVTSTLYISLFKFFFTEVFSDSSIYLTIQNHTLRCKTVSLPLMHDYQNTFLTTREEQTTGSDGGLWGFCTM